MKNQCSFTIGLGVACEKGTWEAHVGSWRVMPTWRISQVSRR